MHSLPIFVRLRDRPVILLGDGEAADAKRRLLERAQAQIIGEDGQAALAIVAIEDDAEAEAAIARLKARGILVNAVDRAAACDFTLPAIVDRDPVIIAIGTGGASAGLAKALRQRLEAMIPAGLGAVTRTLGTSRAALRQRWPNGADRRRAIDTHTRVIATAWTNATACCRANQKKSDMWVVGVGITTGVALNTLRIRIRKRVDALKICEALNPKP